METERPAWVEVNLTTIRQNTHRIQEYITPARGIFAVVKANAYGHGLVEVARAAQEAGAAGMAVAILSEAAELRQAGITVPILMLGAPLPGDADDLVSYDVTANLVNPTIARALDDAARRQGKKAHAHLKIDSGMCRTGSVPAEAPELMRVALSLSNLSVDAAFTHFASSDEPDLSFAHQQLDTFHRCLATLAAEGLCPPKAHAANSAAVLSLPDARHDFVRPGLLVYGIPPYPGAEALLPLEPAMAIKARLVSVKSLPAGSVIGYGSTYKMPRPGRIAILPLGYADGFTRNNSNNGDVLIHGRRAPIRGRICMDQFMVEVTDIPEARVGDEAVLLGRQGEEVIPVTEIAQRTGTIHHEVLSALTTRLPRRYVL